MRSLQWYKRGAAYGFTIRSFMEYVMKQGVAAYESKYGKVKKIRTKSIREVM